MDICPAYWDWLALQFQLGMIASVDMIGRELKEGDDELANWVKARPGHFVSNDDATTQQVFTQIVQAVMSGDYNAGHRDSFLAKADPWIIAKAKSAGAIVVTHESYASFNTKKVKIPNICQQFGVSCLNTFQLLRQLNARFVLASER